MGNSIRKIKRKSKLGGRKWYSTQTEFSVGSSNLSVHSASAYSLSRQSTYSLSRQSTYSASRPWSRSSRRQWKSTTLNDPHEASKTAWPVSVVESLFLPEFPIKGEVTEADFQIEHIIARGAFGKVVKVKKKKTGVVYAMKILSKSQVVMENAVQQCKDEVAIQSLFGHHPFMVECIYFWQSRKQLFLVTEYVSHGELLSLWKSYGKFPEEAVKIYVAELAITLDYLHKSGVIYRDLKMENILLDKDGHVQLIDFGLSKWLQTGGRARTICGTIQYMAPEILRMESYTHSVDWWSLGIIMYALLTAKYPIDTMKDHNQMLDKVLGYNYSLPEEYSLGAKELLWKLLKKDPNKRLQDLRHLKFEQFFSDVNLDLVEKKMISPRKILDDSLLDRQLFEEDHTDLPYASKAPTKQSKTDFEGFSWNGHTTVY